ncbi:MAG: hemerythrin domain-containing protein [Oligoflexus sp.]
MDVLQLIKQYNRDNLAQLGLVAQELGTTNFKSFWQKYRRQLLAQIMIEREYLYPEVAVVSKTAQTTIAQLEANLVQLEQLVQELDAALADSNHNAHQILAERLTCLVRGHVEKQEEKLIPLIRQSMSTEEREELSQVFQDALEDFMNSERMECAV